MPSYGRNPAKGLTPRICEVCGVSFQPYRDSQRTCSLRCYKRSTAVKQREATRKMRPETRERKNVARRIATNPGRRQVNLRQNIKRYGLSFDEYERRLEQQDHCCAICGDAPDPNGVKAASRLHVDHDRATGAVRDLLCGRCNPGLGYFLDSPARLRAAADYIERHRKGDA